MELTITKKDTITQLHESIYTALNYYSNVHRGSGHYSTITTQLFEEARDIVLDYLTLGNEYTVVFCSSRNAEILTQQLKPGSHNTIFSNQIGLPLGIAAVAFNKSGVPANIRFQSGGGTTRLMSTHWVLWNKAPGRFEVGTPSIIAVIALAKGLSLLKLSGNTAHKLSGMETMTPENILYTPGFDALSGVELFDKLSESIIGKGKNVPTTTGDKEFINLDYSASTPAFEPVWEVYKKAWLADAPSQKNLVKYVKDTVLQFVHADSAEFEVTFTSNASEAINLVSESLKKQDDKSGHTVVVNSLMEHSSNDLPWRSINDNPLVHLSVTDHGFFDVEALEKLLSDYNQKQLQGPKRIKLVALAGASNVLGTCNNLSAICKLVHSYGAQLLVDAAQLAAHKPIAMNDFDIDFLAFSAHKVYAPFGTGVLVSRKGSLAFGTSEMDSIQQSGEENVPGIAALGKALQLVQNTGWPTIEAREQALTKNALKAMAEIQDVTIRGINHSHHEKINQKLGVITFEMKGMMATRLANKLALNGAIGIRAGCHCAHIIIKHLLDFGPTGEKMQRFVVKMFPQLNPPGMARISFGMGTTTSDIEQFIELMKNLKTDKVEGAQYSEKQVKGHLNQLVEKIIQEVYY